MNTLFSGSVPTYALDIVNERVAKVNKRAIRRGFPQVAIVVGATELRPDPYGCDIRLHLDGIVPCDCAIAQVEYSQVDITASGSLAMNGWRLVGVIAVDAKDLDGIPVPMTTDVPGESTRGIEISDPFACQHCNTTRQRNETFLVKHDDGTVRQVGRQCIRDFLGHDPAAMLAGLDAFRWIAEISGESEGWGRSAPKVWTVDEILVAAARVVRADGWYVSKAKAIESEYSDCPLLSTASRTMGVLNPYNAKARRENDEDYPHTDAVDVLVMDTKAALDELAKRDAMGEWEWKLVDYRNIASVGARHIGILASAVILGLRQEERKAKADSLPESKHIGTVGAKVTVEATVTFTREFDNQWGRTTLVKFSTPEGDVQWWQTGSHVWEIGSTVTLSGTVKSHEADKLNSRPVTTLTRCKVA